MSKLNGEYAFEFEPDAEDVDALSFAKLSNVDTKDMNMGLLAIVVYGALDARPVLTPKPKSICIAPAVAVGWGIESSSRLSIAGSKLVRELQSSGFVSLDEVDAVGEATDCGGERENIDRGDVGEEVLAVAAAFGTAKVNEDCLRATFSVCRRVSRSRRFSFSFRVCSFLASKSATLSSS